MPTVRGEPRRNVETTSLFWWWGGGVLVALVLGLSVGQLNDATELTPFHEIGHAICLGGALVIALASGFVGFSQTKAAIWRRIAASFGFTLLGALAAFILLSAISDLANRLVDFPAGRTRTYQALLSVNRAYEMRGKGRNWHIQTTPIWSDMKVTHADYRFMLTHRRPGDTGVDPGEISSGGYFCARVVVQQAGEALQVLYAGQHSLPAGTVEVCPRPVARQTRCCSDQP